MIKFTNNTTKFFRLITPTMNKAIEAVARNTQRSVINEFQRFPEATRPIDTGALQQSVTTFPRRGGWVLSAGFGENKELEYARYVEEGTVYMPARPFFRNGIARAQVKNDEIITRFLDAGMLKFLE